MRAVIYARVSSAAQRERDTIASQLRVLPEYVTRQGWELVKPANTYVDDGRTAKAGHLEARTGFAALLRDAAAGVFNVVVVVDLDRLTRSEDLTERGAILGALQRAGVRVASANSGQVLDLSTSMGDLYSSLHTFFAAEENRKRRERTVQGKITAAQRGRKPSGPTPYGLAYDRVTGAWSLDPVRAPILREAFERTAAGEGGRAICRDFTVRGVPPPRSAWDPSSLHRLIRHRFPLGEWTTNYAKGVSIKVPQLIDEELWQRAQDALVSNRKRGLMAHTKHTYLLDRQGRCAACGEPIVIRMNIASNGCRTRSYLCKRRRERYADGVRCDQPIIKTKDADDRVWAKICEQLEVEDLAEMLLAEHERRAGDRHDWEADAAGYRKHLARLAKVEQGLLERFQRGMISDEGFDEGLAKLRREREGVEAQLEFAMSAKASTVAVQDRLRTAEAIVEKLRKRVRNAPPAVRRELARLLIEPGSVLFDNGCIAFTFILRRRETGVYVQPSSTWTQHEDAFRLRLVA